MNRKQGESIGDLKRRLVKEQRESPDPAKEAAAASAKARDHINTVARRRLGSMSRLSKLFPGAHGK